MNLRKKLFLKSRLEKTFEPEKTRFESFYRVKCANFAFLRAILKSTISKNIFLKTMILNQKLFVLSDFEATFLQHIWF